jgi:hypothetical protein
VTVTNVVVLVCSLSGGFDFDLDKVPSVVNDCALLRSNLTLCDIATLGGDYKLPYIVTVNKQKTKWRSTSNVCPNKPRSSDLGA